MSDFALDILDVALAIYKDKIQADLIEDFKEAYRIVLEAEGENRRTKSQALLQRHITHRTNFFHKVFVIFF